MKIKWLHISDIHYHMSNYNSKLLRKDLLDRIRACRETEPFSCIFCTGDIFDKNGQVNDGLTDYINEIINSAGIVKKNFYLVPGNHDRDRNFVSDILTGIYDHNHTTPPKKNSDNSYIDHNVSKLTNSQIETLLKSFSGFLTIYERLIGTNYYSDLLNPHVCTTKSCDSYNIFKINTAWLERDSRNTDELRCGIDKLLEVFELVNFASDTINVAIGHHSLSCFESKEADRIKDLMHRNHVSIYFCGHVHKAFVGYHGNYDIVEIGCSTGINDDYTDGGYTTGILDTDLNCFKAEFYRWNNGRWSTDSNVDGTDENGKYYFNTRKYKHATNKIAIGLRAFGPSVSKNEIAKALNDENFEVIQYPYSDLAVEDLDWGNHNLYITELAQQTIGLKEKEISVFPLAPIPLLIKYGFELQNNFSIKVFQYDRKNYNWVYNDSSCTEYPIINKNFDCRDAKKLVIIISTSTPIDISSIQTLLNIHESDVITFETIQKGLGYPLYHNEYIKVIENIFNKLDLIANKYDEMHLFASVPAGMAVELGRRFQKGVYPQINLYNYFQGYSYVMAINKRF